MRWWRLSTMVVAAVATGAAPSGVVQRLENIKPNQTLVVRETDAGSVSGAPARRR